MNNALIAQLAKHLPPSAATLRLADMGGTAGDVLRLLRPDVAALPVADNGSLTRLGENSVDAITLAADPSPTGAGGGRTSSGDSDNPADAQNLLSADFLAAALHALREGGRLIMFEAHGAANDQHVKTLENAGYTRILVETLTDEDGAALGVLMRGEKPHTQGDTLARIDVAASLDSPRADLTKFKGRYVHVLVRQTPNKPAWALQPDERVEWHIVALAGENGAALAFSSLPSAVGFMQRAVLAGAIQGVSKVAKFTREAAVVWAFPLLINPLFEDVKGRGFAMAYRIDPETAVRGEE